METKIDYAFQRFLQEIGIKITSTNIYKLLKTTLTKNITLLDLFEGGIIEVNSKELMKATGFDNVKEALIYLEQEEMLIEIDRSQDRFVYLSIDFKDIKKKNKIHEDLTNIAKINEKHFQDLVTQIKRYFTNLYKEEAIIMTYEENDPAVLEVTVYFKKNMAEFDLHFEFNDETQEFESLLIQT